jgi:hypothetical protein
MRSLLALQNNNKYTTINKVINRTTTHKPEMNRSSLTSSEMNQELLATINPAKTVQKHGTNSKTMHRQERISIVNSFIALIKFLKSTLQIQVLIYLRTMHRLLNRSHSLIVTLTYLAIYQA